MYLKYIILILLLGSGCQSSSECHNQPTASSSSQNTQTSPYSKAYTECITSSPPNGCIEAELKIQDKKLNRAYQALKHRIQPQRIPQLKAMQRAWIQYRDKKCDFYNYPQRGSGGITDSLQCLLDETIKRTQELNALD